MSTNAYLTALRPRATTVPVVKSETAVACCGCHILYSCPLWPCVCVQCTHYYSARTHARLTRRGPPPGAHNFGFPANPASVVARSDAFRSTPSGIDGLGTHACMHVRVPCPTPDHHQIIAGHSDDWPEIQDRILRANDKTKQNTFLWCDR